MPDSGFTGGGVEEDVGEVLASQRAATKLGHLRIQARVNFRQCGLRNVGVGTECCDQVADLAGGDAVDVGLHHDREQRPVDAAALQQGRGDRALPQLRNSQPPGPPGER